MIPAYNTLMDSLVVISCIGLQVPCCMLLVSTGLRFEGAGMLIVVSSVAVCSFLVDWWRVGSAVAKLRGAGSGFRSCWFVSVQVLSLGVDRGLTIPGYRMNGL